MDSVLSRKLFRDKYVEEIKPQKSNQGGITTLKLAEGGEVFTQGEKLGYMLAPIAASLLQAKQKPGESSLSSLFGAVGEGIAKIPEIGVAIKKLEIAGQPKPVEKVRNLSPEEIKLAKLPTGTFAQIDSAGKINIITKPSDKQLEDNENLLSNITTLNEMKKEYVELGKPVGPWYNLDPDKIGGFVSGMFGGETGKKIKAFNAKNERFGADYRKFISGATVSDKEKANLEKIIPLISDTESEWEGKASAITNYFEDVKKIREAQGLVSINDAAKALENKGVSINNYRQPNINKFKFGADGELQQVK
jgi:hypothetical protein